ncbi:MAG: hypothetical protein ABIA93_00800 [Candidatus Woesearchaeota archaeon]
MNSRAQVSLEYLFIVGLALAIIIPGAYLFYSYSKSSNDDLTSSEIVRVGNEVLRVGEEAYVSGTNSWRTLKVTFPESVQNMIFIDDSNQEMVINYWTENGLTEAVFFVPSGFHFETNETTWIGPLQTWSYKVSPGRNALRLEAKGAGIVFVS